MPSPRDLLSIVAPAISADLRSAPRAARQLGFAGVEVPLVWGTTDLADLSASGQREVSHLLATHEQQLVSISVDLGTKGFGPGADVDRLLARLDKAMAAARGLRAGVISVELGPLPQPKRNAPPPRKVTPQMAGLLILPESVAAQVDPSPAADPETVDPAAFTFVDSALAELGRRADRFSVTLAFRSDLSSFAALERALRAVDCPWFGVDLDPVALLRDEWDPDEVFSRLGMLIRHVRVRDAVGGAGRRTRPAVVGQGDTNWLELLARLDAADYGGWLTVDPTELPDRAGAALSAVKVLRQRS